MPEPKSNSLLGLELEPGPLLIVAYPIAASIVVESLVPGIGR
jgi:hypothetical protein